MEQSEIFDLNCTRCPRLRDFLLDVRKQHPDYHARPVAPFGTALGGRKPLLLIVGLAPGMHGANATGRPFTGDHAGILLYETLYKFGFSNQANATSRDDGLQLNNCRITNAVKCLPPQNKPIGKEITTCNHFLQNELAAIPRGSVIIALGTIAHNAVIRGLGLKVKDYKFVHNSKFSLDDNKYLLDSYHCSRYNTQTRRLTAEMFERVFLQAKNLLTDPDKK